MGRRDGGRACKSGEGTLSSSPVLELSIKSNNVGKESQSE